MNYSVLVSFRLSLKFHTVSFCNFGNLLRTYAFWIDYISNSADTFSDQLKTGGYEQSKLSFYKSIFNWRDSLPYQNN